MDGVLFERLLYEEESAMLDFKRDQYPFAKAGDEEKIAKAKKTIGGTIVGLIIIMLSWAIVNFVIGTTQNVSGIP